MLKNIFFIVLFTLTVGCGYEAIYSKKNIILSSDFSINKIISDGDRGLNIKIERKLKNYSNPEKKKKYTIKVKSETLKTIIGKDLKGDPTIYRIDVKVDIIAESKGNKEINMQFNKSFKYNNNQDKFELKRSEDEIKNNLVETIIQDLIFRLVSL